MNASSKSFRTNSRSSQAPNRTAGVVPVTQLCEIACIVLCRIVVPKLAHSVDLAG